MLQPSSTLTQRTIYDCCQLARGEIVVRGAERDTYPAMHLELLYSRHAWRLSSWPSIV